MVVGRPSLVFGGISGSFVHAFKTEEFLKDKSINDDTVFSGALKVLAQEVSPSDNPVDASVSYRKHLTQAIMYKVKEI